MPLREPAPFAGTPLTGAKVLLVEDYDDTRELFAELLEMFGAAVVQARNGREGLEAFRAERPALVVSDIAMDEMDGYALLRAIRALPPEEGGLTPAVAVTAQGAKDEALAAGFQAFLAKPVDPARLVEVVRSLVAAPSGQPAR